MLNQYIHQIFNRDSGFLRITERGPRSEENVRMDLSLQGHKAL